VGGLIGSTFGVYLFSFLRSVGQLDLIISILYVVFLGSIGTLMTIESLNAIRKSKNNIAPVKRKSDHSSWIYALPFKMRFRKSKLYLSAIPVVALGILVGILAAIMGVGGGFIMVPAMIYLLRVPTNVVIGTSLFQIIFVTAYTTIIQSTTNQTVDIVLAFILMVGGVIGAQFGAAAGHKLKGEQLRALLGLLVLGVCIRLGYDLIATPADFFNLIGTSAQGGH